MSEPEVIVIVIGLVVIIYNIYTDNINWFFVKVYVPIATVLVVIANWLGL
tara:strand:+ start:851 stop:1000 length:150 start_codon:yes stop_codon:yes gene_type:complete